MCYVAGDEIGSLFAGKLVPADSGDWLFIAWRNVGPNGDFVGELSDPYPVSVDDDGNLRVAWLPGGGFCRKD